MRMKSMNRHTLMGLAMIPAILIGCQDFLAEEKSEAKKPSPSTQELALQTGDSQDSIDCAALEARLTAAFNNPAIYYPIKDSLYKFCWITPPPPPPDTTSLCKGLVSQMTDEKSLTLEGYYQFSRDKFDAMNCAQLVGPAPAAPTFSSTKSVQTPEISKPAPVVETTQPLDGSEFCRGLQEKMESELARNDVTYYLQLKTLFGENSCTWVTVQNPTPVSTPPSDPCVSAYQSLATVEPDSPKALSLKTYIAEKCPAKP